MALELLATPHGENLYLVEAAGELWSDGGVAPDRTGELLPMLERAIHHGTLPFAARLAGLVVADRAAAEENSELDRLILAVVHNLRPWRRQSTVFDAGRELWHFAESWKLTRIPGVTELARAAIVPSGGTYGACLAGLVRRELRTGDIDRARIARARDALFARDAAS
jgi:transposase